MYVNKVGTFGVSCASYWWTRISAAGMRATHPLLGAEYMLDLLLYADDLESLELGPQGYLASPSSGLDPRKVLCGVARHGNGVQQLPIGPCN